MRIHSKAIEVPPATLHQSANSVQLVTRDEGEGEVHSGLDVLLGIRTHLVLPTPRSFVGPVLVAPQLSFPRPCSRRCSGLFACRLSR